MSPVQDQVIARLAAGQTLTSAAAALALPRTTIHAWKRQDPDFADALRDAQADAAAQTRELHQAHAANALALVVELMTNPNTAPSIRLKAALYLLAQSAVPAPKPETQDERRTARLLRLGLHPQTEADTYPEYAAQQEAERAAALATLPQNSSEFITSTPPVELASAPIQQNSSPLATVVRPGLKVGRHEPCPCGSTRKHQHCCLDQSSQAA